MRGCYTETHYRFQNDSQEQLQKLRPNLPCSLCKRVHNFFPFVTHFNSDFLVNSHRNSLTSNTKPSVPFLVITKPQEFMP